jgi:hypothetical protein
VRGTEEISDGKPRIKPDPTTGAIIRPLINKEGVPRVNLKGEPQGFIILTSFETFIQQTSLSSSLVTKGRQCTVFGSIKALENAVKSWNESKNVPGKILVQEMLESDFLEQYPDTDEERLNMFLKRAGSDPDAPYCTVEGVRIVSNNVFTTNTDEVDVFIKHDNAAEIRAHNKSLRQATTPLDQP